jgi:hypothetical protein
LRIELEADTTKDYYDLYGEDEMSIQVEYYRNNVLTFIGYLDDEGWYEDYANSEWIVSFDCYDGLGYLENLAYVDSNGLNFSGVQTPLEITVNCLNRFNNAQDIKVNIELRYVGLSTLADTFNTAKFNSERFYQKDDEPMSCLDVLRSTLEVFNACIAMRRGEWFIYRPNDLYANALNPTYHHYDSTGAARSPGVVSPNLICFSGTQSYNYIPYHIEENQQLSRRKAIGKCQVNYKYGPATSLIGANKYWYTSDGSTYTDWTINSTNNMTIPSAGGYGVTLNNVAFAAGEKQLTSSSTISITATDTI